MCGVRCAMCVRCAVSSTNHPSSSSSSSCDVARAVSVKDNHRRHGCPSTLKDRVESIDRVESSRSIASIDRLRRSIVDRSSGIALNSRRCNRAAVVHRTRATTTTTTTTGAGAG